MNESHLSVSITSKEICRDAAGLIRDRGWCQNTFGDDQGRVCILGAIHLTCEDGGYHNARRFLSERTGITNLIGWNDAKGRTATEVITLLEEAGRE